MAQNNFVRLIEKTKQCYCKGHIKQCNKDKKLSSVIQSLQQDKPKSKLLDGYLDSDLPQIFNSFFVNKISDIHAKLDVTVNPNGNYNEVESATSQMKELIPAN